MTKIDRFDLADLTIWSPRFTTTSQNEEYFMNHMETQFASTKKISLHDSRVSLNVKDK